MTDDDDTTTPTVDDIEVFAPRLTFPYWWLLEQRQLIRLDRHMGIHGPWWRRQPQRREFWRSVISIADHPRGPGQTT